MNATLTPAEMDTLVGVAERSVRMAVSGHLAWRPSPADYPPSLRERGAAFVTLMREGRLRGCIGTLAAVEPLVVTVADRARAAALTDPRFRPVGPDELGDLDVEVSVLSAPEPLAVTGYDDLVARARPGVDGLIVEAGNHRATLLPSVWDDLPLSYEFVAALWRKAGLEPGEWPPGIRIARYTAQHAAHEEG